MIGWLLGVPSKRKTLRLTTTQVLFALLGAVRELIRKVDLMAGELDELKAAVEKDLAVDQSAITLLNGLKAKLDAAIASGNPQALKDLSASIGASTDALAAAVVANTPAE